MPKLKRKSEYLLDYQNQIAFTPEKYRRLGMRAIYAAYRYGLTTLRDLARFYYEHGTFLDIPGVGVMSDRWLRNNIPYDKAVKGE